MEIRCKRIIDGKTYNTETSTKITGYSGDTGAGIITEYLFLNRFGALFLYRSAVDLSGEVEEEIQPYDEPKARAWLKMQSDGADHIDALFGETPEAGESKFTLRMPDSLRVRLTVLAKENGQSLNAWIVRCLERCAVGANEPVTLKRIV